MIIKLTRCDGVRAIVAHFLSGWPLEPDLSWRHVPERLVVVTWRLNICLQFPERRIKKIVSLQQHFDSRPISVRHLLSRSEIHLLCLPVYAAFGRDRSQIINGKPDYQREAGRHQHQLLRNKTVEDLQRRPTYFCEAVSTNMSMDATSFDERAALLRSENRPYQSLGSVHHNKCKVYKRRWYILALFSVVASLNNIIWNCWGPIQATSQVVFGWDKTTITLLADWGPISYVVAVVPMSWLMDVKGVCL